MGSTTRGICLSKHQQERNERKREKSPIQPCRGSSRGMKRSVVEKAGTGSRGRARLVSGTEENPRAEAQPGAWEQLWNEG